MQHGDDSPSVPDMFALRAALWRGVGAARARGVSGHDALLDAAVEEAQHWAARRRPPCPLDIDATRAALEALAGGPDAAIWTEPLPPPDPMPETLAELVSHAVERYGGECLWYANLDLILAEPERGWSSVVRGLREHGGPDPRPYWLADRIERAAAIEEFEQTKARMRATMTLEVPPDATEEDLDRLAVELTRRLRPDQGGGQP